MQACWNYKHRRQQVMYGSPVKSPFPSRSIGRGEAAVNNYYIARGKEGGWGALEKSREKKTPCTLIAFLSFYASCYNTSHIHSFLLPFCTASSFRCKSQFHVLSHPLGSLSYIPACLWKMAERKMELDGSLIVLSSLKLVRCLILLDSVVTAHYHQLVTNMKQEPEVFYLKPIQHVWLTDTWWFME